MLRPEVFADARTRGIREVFCGKSWSEVCNADYAYKFAHQRPATVFDELHEELIILPANLDILAGEEYIRHELFRGRDPLDILEPAFRNGLAAGENWGDLSANKEWSQMLMPIPATKTRDLGFGRMVVSEWEKRGWSRERLHESLVKQRRDRRLVDDCVYVVEPPYPIDDHCGDEGWGIRRF